MTQARTVLALLVLIAGGAAAYVFLVPKDVERAAIDDEEVCPGVMLVGTDGGTLRSRPMALSRGVQNLPSGAKLYLCEDRGDWLGVVAPGAGDACHAALRQAAGDLPEGCYSGWIKRGSTVFAAG